MFLHFHYQHICSQVFRNEAIHNDLLLTSGKKVLIFNHTLLPNPLKMCSLTEFRNISDVENKDIVCDALIKHWKTH